MKRGCLRILVVAAAVACLCIGSSAIAGLTTTGDQLWHQDVSEVVDKAEAGDRFGLALSWGDFNGDGYGDLAIGAPYENVDSMSDGGQVSVLYGSPDGLSTARNQVWNQNRADIQDKVEPSDRFGFALTSGDFDGDGYGDLAIGIPYEDIGSKADAGAVHILYGSSSGLSAARDQFFHQDSSDVENLAEVADRFGSALTSGDFNGDGYGDLAIGVPYEDLEDKADIGAVNILYGSAQGLTASGNQFFHQNSSGVEDAAEASDRFGSALASGDFDADGYMDLAIGVPFEDVGSKADTGAVNVLYGSAQRLTTSGDQFFHQDSSGVENAAEASDRFGSALASGDFDADGYSDLAIGVPYEDIDDKRDAGAVNVLYGASFGLSTTGDDFFHQGTAGVENPVEASDHFGATLTSGDFNANGYGDLAIGVPYEDIEDKADVGAVNVLYGFAQGLSTTGNQFFYQSRSGVKDAAEASDRFGSALAGGDFNADGYSDLAIGVPYEDVESKQDAGAVNVLYGS